MPVRMLEADLLTLDEVVARSILDELGIRLHVGFRGINQLAEPYIVVYVLEHWIDFVAEVRL